MTTDRKDTVQGYSYPTPSIEGVTISSLPSPAPQTLSPASVERIKQAARAMPDPKDQQCGSES